MSKITDKLQAIATPEPAKASAWFFKTGKGQYGEGDIFIGISNPDLRAVCKNYKYLIFSELQELKASMNSKEDSSVNVSKKVKI